MIPFLAGAGTALTACILLASLRSWSDVSPIGQMLAALFAGVILGAALMGLMGSRACAGELRYTSAHRSAPSFATGLGEGLAHMVGLDRHEQRTARRRD